MTLPAANMLNIKLNIGAKPKEKSSFAVLSAQQNVRQTSKEAVSVTNNGEKISCI